MRSIILVIIYLIVCVLSIPCHLILLIVRPINKWAAAVVSQKIVWLAFRLCMAVSGCRREIVGREKIPTDTPVMYAANHRGFYDIILMYTVVPTQTLFVSKIELKKFVCIAQWMYFLNCQWMDRGNIKQNLNTILTTIDYAKQGYSVYISPEGTRNTTDELLPFHEGSMKIATKAKIPIVPVVFTGTEEILEKHLPWIHRGPIRVEFGDPIYPDQLDKEDKKHLGAYTREILQGIYNRAAGIEENEEDLK
ncbi:MAG: 1-acyl-sn-glycerol-3-phosphate acyltransferase [Eubacterium sp.]|nr:1-acyl-sn-glycerol-3-phosphate acyltransferase [Eubacterium sp.]